MDNKDLVCNVLTELEKGLDEAYRRVCEMKASNRIIEDNLIAMYRKIKALESDLKGTTSNQNVSVIGSRKSLQVVETHEGRNAFLCDLSQIWGPNTEAEFLAEVLYDYEQISSSIHNVQKSSVLAISVNNNSFDQVNSAIDAAQPIVLMLLSDEFENHQEYERLFQKVPLVYRQYRYDSYENPVNQRILPLGYHCWDQHARRDTAVKKYIWSFTGTAKNDRLKDLSILDDLKPNFHGETNSEENPDILNSSIFIYCPVGNYNVETNRSYTASMCGAIPCIVCTQSQWDSTYPHFDIEPPWLHASSVEEIKDMMQSLMNDKAKLTALQSEILKWWTDIKITIRDNIELAIAKEMKK
tara:strand:- start:753 stop:1817 length:1065 start_codon:yes stop_codon:yes gene_type:complete